MKIKSYFGYMILICTFFSLTCKKHDADTVFNGSARITGAVLFTNIATNTNDTAKKATITMTQMGNSSANDYVTQLTNGTFDINNLKKGAYEFNIKFFYTQPGSTNGDYYTVNQQVTFNPGQWLNPYNFVLTIDSTSSPTLQIEITDAYGNVINNANVCLYSSPSILTANQGTCVGSVTSGVTNAEGIVLFEGLQTKQNYYVSAYASLGINLLSNWSATASTAVAAAQGTSPLAHQSDTLKPTGQAVIFTVNPVATNVPADGVTTVAIGAKINTALLANPQNVVFTSGGGTFGNGTATITQAADLNGNATVYLKSGMVGTFQVSINYDNLTQIVPVTFVPAPPDAIVLSAPPTLLDTNANNSLPITITLLRNIGTPSPGLLFNYTYTATGSIGALAGFGSETASSTSGTTSTASFVFSTGSPNYTGTVTITVSLLQNPAITSSVIVQVVN